MFGWFKDKAIRENKLILRQNVDASAYLANELKTAPVRSGTTDRLQSEMESIHAQAIQQQRAWDQSTPLQSEALEWAWKTNKRLREVYSWFDDSRHFGFDNRFGGS